eukprot:c7541_g1_i1.p1 GENE.c7541_g1_i1~~c7541_g1_i1.p1  ORF type:complete len:338 (-),score=65.78 c7541_g1_i1:9-1022(-)
MDFRNKKILAPMVRVGTLPFRLLALNYGADIVYTEELIDRKLIRCTRHENTELGCIDYMLTEKDRMHKALPSDLVFRTCPQLEKSQLVLQLGTNNATTALQAAQIVCNDVSCIDINMGCPMKFSTQMGAGAELLKKPDLIRDILTTLVRNLPIPVTCKIRLLPNASETLELVKMIEQTGVSAIAIHGRTDAMKSREPALWSEIAALTEHISIPVIANGDMWSGDDFSRAKKEIGCSSVMYARGALLNPSLFREDGCLPIYDVMNDYLTLCERYNERIQNVKYVLLQFHKYGHYNPLMSSLTTANAEDLRKIRTMSELATFCSHQRDEAPTKRQRTVE